MTIRKLSPIQNFELPEDFDRGVDPNALRDWAPELEAVKALAGDGDTVIELYDVIGFDPFFGGISARAIAGQLRGAKDVVVNINSPGGSFVEGNAIYNLLVQHPGKVTVNVIGWAASAASIIAMAGDVRRISPSGFVMIHNGQAGVEGDRHDLRETADLLEKIDDVLVGVYASSTKVGKRDLATMLDDETTMTAKDAVAKGFMDEILDAGSIATSAKVRNEAQSVKVDRMMDLAISRQYPALSRSQRIELKNAYRENTRDAVFTPTRDAGLADCASDLRKLLETL